MDKATLQRAVARHRDKILPPYDAIVGLDGLEAVCAIAALLGGQNVYVPSARTIFGACLEAEARDEYYSKKNNSLSAMARRYGYTERTLRRKIKDT